MSFILKNKSLIFILKMIIKTNNNSQNYKLVFQSAITRNGERKFFMEQNYLRIFCLVLKIYLIDRKTEFSIKLTELNLLKNEYI